MIEVLPIRLLTDSDSQIFGSLSVALGKLDRAGLPVSLGIVVTCPEFKLKTILEHHDFGSKEIFEQSLTLVKKEINSIPIPEILQKETKGHNLFLLNNKVVKSQKALWQTLLNNWLSQIKDRLWKDGFYKGLTEGLDPQIVTFVKKIESFGLAYFDVTSDDVQINIKAGKLHPNDLHKLHEIVMQANKKLFMAHEYEWIYDKGVKLVRVLPYTPLPVILSGRESSDSRVKDLSRMRDSNTFATLSAGKLRDSSLIAQNDKRSAVKVFFDLSEGFTIEKNIDGIYIASEKMFDLNRTKDSFENLTYRLVESALTFPNSPILFKLADKSEGMGKVRGTLRLLHQKSLLDPLMEILDFVRHKKGFNNVHIVIPFVRGVSELSQIKRELAVHKLMRKASLKQWLEITIPENMINLEEYLVLGIDGVVLNLDELISHLNGFDHSEQELISYKNEVSGLIKFLEDGLKLLHKSKIPFIAYGSLSLYPEVLEFLVEKGVYGIVIQRYEAPSAKELLHQAEKRLVLRKAF